MLCVVGSTRNAGVSGAGITPRKDRFCDLMETEKRDLLLPRTCGPGQAQQSAFALWHGLEIIISDSHGFRGRSGMEIVSGAQSGFPVLAQSSNVLLGAERLLSVGVEVFRRLQLPIPGEIEHERAGDRSPGLPLNRQRRPSPANRRASQIEHSKGRGEKQLMFVFGKRENIVRGRAKNWHVRAPQNHPRTSHGQSTTFNTGR